MSCTEYTGIHDHIQYISRRSLHFAQCKTFQMIHRFSGVHPFLIIRYRCSIFSGRSTRAFTRLIYIHLRTDTVSIIRYTAKLFGSILTQPPVGVERSFKSPVISQDRGRGIVIVMTPLTVYLIIACHQIVWLCCLYADFKTTQINFSLSTLGNHRITPVSVSLLTVDCVMLRHNGYTCILHASGRR